jgi:hypothetical protein
MFRFALIDLSFNYALSVRSLIDRATVCAHRARVAQHRLAAHDRAPIRQGPLKNCGCRYVDCCCFRLFVSRPCPCNKSRAPRRISPRWSAARRSPRRYRYVSTFFEAMLSVIYFGVLNVWFVLNSMFCHSLALSIGVDGREARQSEKSQSNFEFRSAACQRSLTIDGNIMNAIIENRNHSDRWCRLKGRSGCRRRRCC